jgi:hypothetical protein
MHLPRLFIKAAIPIISIFLILAGIIQLRAQLWVAGAISVRLVYRRTKPNEILFEDYILTAHD